MPERSGRARGACPATAAIQGHEPLFILRNDAVVQGLSECPSMDDVERWGVFTIGIGLGNARFTYGS